MFWDVAPSALRSGASSILRSAPPRSLCSPRTLIGLPPLLDWIFARNTGALVKISLNRKIVNCPCATCYVLLTSKARSSKAPWRVPRPHMNRESWIPCEIPGSSPADRLHKRQRTLSCFMIRNLSADRLDEGGPLGFYEEECWGGRCGRKGR